MYKYVHNNKYQMKYREFTKYSEKWKIIFIPGEARLEIFFEK